MMRVTFRSLEAWPYAPTERRRGPGTFSANWPATLRLLEREVSIIGGLGDVTIAAGFRAEDLRLDGMPRAGAREPTHPGVIIAFTAQGLDGLPRLEYGTDVCERWQHNVRSIALGLESLRAVDRYGITRRSEQYAGFREITAGADEPSIARGRRLIETHGGVRAALRATHPDTGGDRVDLESVIRASHAIDDVGA